MSQYGRLWEEHRTQRSRVAEGLRELADAIERGVEADEITRLERVVVGRRATLASTERQMEACPE